VLVQHPVDRAAIAKPVLPRLGGDAADLRILVDPDDTRFGQRFQRRFGMRSGGASRVGGVGALNRPGFDRLIPDMHGHQGLAPRDPLRERGVKGDARKLALQIQRIGLAINGIVQDGIDIGKDRVLGDALLAIMLDELVERPIGDVVDALAGTGVTKTGGALCSPISSFERSEIKKPASRQR